MTLAYQSATYQPNDCIALAPTWLYQDFEQRALQISQQLQQQKINAIAVWFEDGANLACTLLGSVIRCRPIPPE